MQRIVERMTPDNGPEVITHNSQTNGNQLARILQELGIFLSLFSTELLPQYEFKLAHN